MYKFIYFSKKNYENHFQLLIKSKDETFNSENNS